MLIFEEGRSLNIVGKTEFFGSIMRDLGSNFYLASVCVACLRSDVLTGLTCRSLIARPYHALLAPVMPGGEGGPALPPGSRQIIVDGIRQTGTAPEVWEDDRRRPRKLNGEFDVGDS